MTESGTADANQRIIYHIQIFEPAGSLYANHMIYRMGHDRSEMEIVGDRHGFPRHKFYIDNVQDLERITSMLNDHNIMHRVRILDEPLMLFEYDWRE